ncbi:MAG: ATP-dependent RNA helicase [Planctomycetota bacterium]|nr:MAG: ATP-dependent RNA helicase [Planctomycetota bacterium]
MTRLPNDSDSAPESGFSSLGLSPRLLKALESKGYTQPSPIQAQAIPVLLSGRDLVGQAQTGTGKTAAFALPLLQKLDKDMARGDRRPRALVLAPTRELAVQVCQATEGYAGEGSGLSFVTVYGGAPIFTQLKALRRGAQVVVGTPGRIMDCIRRDALDLSGIETVVLDEADEMLRMGFIEDVEWILSHTPASRQTALFSATMPEEIRRVAQQYLNSPEHVSVKAQTRTVQKIEQRCLIVPHRQKLTALCRILEAEASDAVLIFARTRSNCNDLTEQLQERGFTCSALHGDVSQNQREDIVRGMKSRRIKIVVATDVAARGLDVDTISHVINYDMPTDAETFVHRIGRTGRAGRTGVTLLLLTPKERRSLRAIERFTGQRMEEIQVPSNAEIAQCRQRQLRARIAEIAKESKESGEDLGPYRQLVTELLANDAQDLGPVELAAVLARLAADNKPLVFDEPEWERHSGKDPRDGDRNFVRLYVSAGYSSGLRPGQLVAAIANSANIPGKAIGAIDIRENASFFDLDERFQDQLRDNVHRIQIRGRSVDIQPARPYSDKREGKRRSHGPRPHVHRAHPRPRPGKGARPYGGRPKPGSRNPNSWR